MSEAIWNDFDFHHCADLLKLILLAILQRLPTTQNFKSAILRSQRVKLDLVLGTIDFLDPTQKFSQAIKSAFTQTLDTLESLVLDTVRPTSGEHEPVSSSKLYVLARTLSRDGNEEAAQYLDLEKLSFDVFENLDHLIEALRQCKRQIAVPDPVDPSDLAKPQAFDDAWHMLYEHLSNLMVCSTPHETHQMRIFLGSSESQSEALRLLHRQRTMDVWHHIDFCYELSNENDRELNREEIVVACQLCARLAKAPKFRALKFCYNSEKIWPGSRGVELARSQRTPQFQNVETWLKQETKRAHRKALQCILAQWLGHAYGTPWLPLDWNIQTIWLDASIVADSYRSTYTTYQPRQAIVSQEPPDAASMIRFALLMLRIEFPKADFTIENEDELSCDELDEHLQTILETESISKEMEPRFEKVLKICHNWDASSLPNRQFVLDRIFKPLKEDLVWRFELDVPEPPAKPKSHSTCQATTYGLTASGVSRPEPLDELEDSEPFCLHDDGEEESLDVKELVCLAVVIDAG